MQKPDTIDPDLPGIIFRNVLTNYFPEKLLEFDRKPIHFSNLIYDFEVREAFKKETVNVLLCNARTYTVTDLQNLLLIFDNEMQDYYAYAFILFIQKLINKSNITFDNFQSTLQFIELNPTARSFNSMLDASEIWDRTLHAREITRLFFARGKLYFVSNFLEHHFRKGYDYNHLHQIDFREFNLTEVLPDGVDKNILFSNAIFYAFDLCMQQTNISVNEVIAKSKAPLEIVERSFRYRAEMIT